MNVTKLVPEAIMPARPLAGAAGYDLFSIGDYVVQPGRRVVVSTGLTINLPEGTYGRIEPRTGLAVKHGVGVLAGIIDPDYKDEIKVVLQNHDPDRSFVIRPGYRVAQLVLGSYI